MSLALAGSGGKDSALALRTLRAGGRDPSALTNTGEVVVRDGFVCCDILPAAAAVA